MKSIVGIVLVSCLGCNSRANGQIAVPGVVESRSPRAHLFERYGKLPLSFETNTGQVDKSVRFLSRGDGYQLFLTDEEAVLELRTGACAGEMPPTPRPQAKPRKALCSHPQGLVRIRPEGASTEVAAPVGEEQLPGTANYFIGNDPAKWHRKVPTSAKVRYRGVYPGVDLVYYGNQRQLEYDFIVASGGDPRPIRLRLSGATSLRLSGEGDLLVTLARGELVFHKPVVYQVVKGERRPITGGFAFLPKHTIGFRLGAYDHGKPLVIDPVLVYSTYLGGNSSYSDGARSVAADAEGNVYVTGSADSVDFPVTQAAFQKTNNAAGNHGYNAFVAKLNPTLTALVYSTYLGGRGVSYEGDFAYGLAIDGSNNAYIAGSTYSSDFPVTQGAFQTMKSGYFTGFVTKLNPSGSAMVYSTYLGGSGNALSGGDSATSVAVDAVGDAYIAGSTASSNFPVTEGAYQSTNNTQNLAQSEFAPTGTNAFITKLNPAGSALLYSTYLGGGGFYRSGGYIYGDGATGLALDSSGNAYVTGYAYSSNFPVTAGAFQTRNNAASYYGQNAFVTKLNANGTDLVYSTYLGGSVFSFYAGDSSSALALDDTGNAYVTGTAISSDFPVTPGAFQSTNKSAGYCSGQNAFVTKLNANGTALVYSTYLGGSGIFPGGGCYKLGEIANGLVLDSSGNAYVTGGTASTDFPVTPGALQTANNAAANSGYNIFVTELSATGTGLVYSTYLGGVNKGNSTGDIANGLAIDRSGDVYITGATVSASFPVTPGVFQPTNHSTNGGSNAFVAKLNLSAGLIAPSITSGGIVPVYSTVNTIQSGEWVSIYGSNLATSTATWSGNFPTSLRGTSVTVDGKAAYLWFVSPTQINLQAPEDTATGSVPVVVTTPDGTVTLTVTLAHFAPSFSLLDSKHVAGIILRSNSSGAEGGGAYDIIGPTGNSLGYPTVAAKAGDTVELFAVGLGPTNPVVPSGRAFSGAAPTTNPVGLFINNVKVIPTFAGLSSAGLYQINLTVPAGLGEGDVPLVAIVGGVQTPPNVVISLQ